MIDLDEKIPSKKSTFAVNFPPFFRTNYKMHNTKIVDKYHISTIYGTYVMGNDTFSNIFLKILDFYHNLYLIIRLTH